MKFLGVVATAVVSAATLAFLATVGGAAALFGFIVDLGTGVWVIGWAESLDRDYRDDPVYKNKVQELIERNKSFEEERERRDRAH